MQLDEETTFEGGSRPLEEPEAMRTTDDQEDAVGCHDETEVVEMAMVALSLLRRDDKTMLQQVKHLVKANHQLAQKVDVFLFIYLSFITFCKYFCCCQHLPVVWSNTE